VLPPLRTTPVARSRRFGRSQNSEQAIQLFIALLTCE
jgi:hypothetical protein